MVSNGLQLSRLPSVEPAHGAATSFCPFLAGSSTRSSDSQGTRTAWRSCGCCLGLRLGADWWCGKELVEDEEKPLSIWIENQVSYGQAVKITRWTDTRSPLEVFHRFDHCGSHHVPLRWPDRESLHCGAHLVAAAEKVGASLTKVMSFNDTCNNEY